MLQRATPGWVCGLATLLLATSGCTSLTGGQLGHWNWSNPFSRKPKSVESRYGEPERIVAIWTPDVLQVAGKPPTRGFGGRIYFYNNRKETIPVDGKLLVYGFDDTDHERGSTVPDKRFAFTPEQFTQHFSETDLGASYSVWIPWDSGDRTHKAVSLVPVFTSASGQIVRGQPSLNALAGRKPEHLKRKGQSGEHPELIDNQVQSASFDHHPGAAVQPWGPATPDERQRAGRRTTTIEMPKSMAARSAMSGNSPAGAEAQSIRQNLEAYNNYQRQSPVGPQQMPAGPNWGPSRGRYPTNHGSYAAEGAPFRAPGQEPPRARFEHHALQAPTLSGVRPIRDPAPWGPHPAEPPRTHPY
jgi:hypothetical protein